MAAPQLYSPTAHCQEAFHNLPHPSPGFQNRRNVDEGGFGMRAQGVDAGYTISRPVTQGPRH